MELADDITTLTYVRAVPLVVIILSTLWFATNPSTDTLTTLVSVGLVMTLFYGLATVLDMVL